MGSVWISTDLQLDRRVAVKLMAVAYADNQQARARFLREAQSAAKIQSPNVVQILDYGLDGTTPYIVMEWLVGENLGTRLKRERTLSPQAVATILRQVGRGLRKAHELGVVHRDLKPDNVVLSRAGRIVVTDFGIAYSLESTDARRTGNLVGTPYYMAPEQVDRRHAIDARADYYALGVLLFEASTGRTLPRPAARPSDSSGRPSS